MTRTKESPEWVQEVQIAYHALDQSIHRMGQELQTFSRNPVIGRIDVHAWSQMRNRFYEVLPSIVDELPESIYLEGRQRPRVVSVPIKVKNVGIVDIGSSSPAFAKHYLPRTDEFYHYRPFFALVLRIVVISKKDEMYDPTSPRFIGFEQIRQSSSNSSGYFRQLTHGDKYTSDYWMNYDQQLSVKEIQRILEVAKSSLKTPDRLELVKELEEDLAEIERERLERRHEVENEHGKYLRNRLVNLRNVIWRTPLASLFPRRLEVLPWYKNYDTEEFVKGDRTYFLTDVSELVAVPEREMSFLGFSRKRLDFSHSRQLEPREWCYYTDCTARRLMYFFPESIRDYVTSQIL